MKDYNNKANTPKDGSSQNVFRPTIPNDSRYDAMITAAKIFTVLQLFEEKKLDVRSHCGNVYLCKLNLHGLIKQRC